VHDYKNKCGTQRIFSLLSLFKMCMPRFCTVAVVLCLAQLGALIMAYGYAAASISSFDEYDSATPIGYAFGVPDRLHALQSTVWSCVGLQVLIAVVVVYGAACAR